MALWPQLARRLYADFNDCVKRGLRINGLWIDERAVEGRTLTDQSPPADKLKVVGNFYRFY